MKKTNLLFLSIALLLFTACGGKKQLIVGCAPGIHRELLEFVQPILEREGIALEIRTYTDYHSMNQAVEQEELDANFFQPLPNLTEYNAAAGSDLQSAGAVFFEPLGIYSLRYTSLDQLPHFATVALPADPSAQSRALNLLEEQGLITLGEAELPTLEQVLVRKNDLNILEMEGSEIARRLPEVDFGVSGSNYALQANQTDRLIAAESPSTPAAEQAAYIIATQRGRENDRRIKLLVRALQSRQAAEYMQQKYGSQILPVD